MRGEEYRLDLGIEHGDQDGGVHSGQSIDVHPRRGRGRPTHRPDRLVGDQASRSATIRQYLRRHGIRITMPRKQNEQEA